MIDKDNILDRLQDGDSIDQIAKEIADELNDIQKTYKETTKREKVIEAKEDAASALLNALADYLYAAGEEELLDELNKVSSKEVVRLLDETLPSIKFFQKLSKNQEDVSIEDVMREWQRLWEAV